jgi:hypothetical protein
MAIIIAFNREGRLDKSSQCSTYIEGVIIVMCRLQRFAITFACLYYSQAHTIQIQNKIGSQLTIFTDNDDFKPIFALWLSDYSILLKGAGLHNHNQWTHDQCKAKRGNHRDKYTRVTTDRKN